MQSLVYDSFTLDYSIQIGNIYSLDYLVGSLERSEISEVEDFGLGWYFLGESALISYVMGYERIFTNFI
jgi:hypothetical protein